MWLCSTEIVCRRFNITAEGKVWCRTQLQYCPAAAVFPIPNRAMSKVQSKSVAAAAVTPALQHQAASEGMSLPLQGQSPVLKKCEILQCTEGSVCSSAWHQNSSNCCCLGPLPLVAWVLLGSSPPRRGLCCVVQSRRALKQQKLNCPVWFSCWLVRLASCCSVCYF